MTRLAYAGVGVALVAGDAVAGTWLACIAIVKGWVLP